MIDILFNSGRRRFRYRNVVFILPDGVSSHQISLCHSIAGIHLCADYQCERNACRNVARYTIAGDYGEMQICTECFHALQTRSGRRIVWREVN